MSADVVNIGVYRFTREHQRFSRNGGLDAKGKCNHKHFTMDDNGHTVTCDDCNSQVSAYYALMVVREHWAEATHKVDSDRQKADQALGATIHLRAARVVEKAWRDKQMVPTCPHCCEGISAQDNFGSSAINRVIDDARRMQRAEQKKLRAQPQPTT